MIFEVVIILDVEYPTDYKILNVVGQSTTTVTAKHTIPHVPLLFTVTAAVAAVSPAVGTPTGTVEFFDNGVSLGSRALDSTGHAPINVIIAALGQVTILVKYYGDLNFQASQGTINLPH